MKSIIKEQKKSPMATKVFERQDIDQEYQWSIENIYIDQNAWELDFKKVIGMIEEFQNYRGLLKNGNHLLNALNLYEQMSEKTLKVYTYARMKRDEDNRLTKYQELSERAQGLYAKTEEATAYFIPEILELSQVQLDEYYNTIEGLKKFEHFLNEILRQKDHVLSVKEEEIIARASEMAQGAENVFSMLNNADMQFPVIKNESGDEIEVTKGNYGQLMESSDRRVRKDAFIALYSTYNKYRNTLAATFTANIKKDIFFAKVKKHSSSLHAALFQNNIPVDVYTNLIDTIHDFLPLMHRYVRLRKKMLRLDEIHMYDLYVPIIENVEMIVPYHEGKRILIEGLAPLGEEYINIVKSGFKNRWVDVYENKGKTSGAYSWGTYDSYPFILMNYKDTVDSLFTLAHEMGHSLHSYYTAQNQPYIYSDYKIFVAEVASTVNEALLMNYMLEKIENPDEKMYLINHYLEQFRGTVYRQTMFAEFEKITHDEIEDGKALSAEGLCSIYRELNKKYYGPDMVVDKEIDIEWARIPHFYRNFYVYQYATGYSAAIALSKQILKEGTGAATRYIEFLKSGSSKYSIDVLKMAGVDMTSSQPIKDALSVFEELLNELERLYDGQQR